MPRIEGKEIAHEILGKLTALPKPEGFFAAILVGDDPSSINFVGQKAKVAESLGIDFRIHRLSADITTDALRREVARLSEPKACAGCIVQLPLPEGVNRHYALNAIPKWKDPDLLNESALGAFYSGRHAIVPPAVAVAKEIIERQKLDLRTLRVTMIGKGFLIGKPIGFWLQDKVSELTIFDSKSKNIRDHLAEADIVVCGAGVAGLFGAEHVKPGALVLDFGWNQVGGKLVGDFDAGSASSPQDDPADSLQSKNIFYTPTPGGTGPILVAKLFENYFRLNDSNARGAEHGES